MGQVRVHLLVAAIEGRGVRLGFQHRAVRTRVGRTLTACCILLLEVLGEALEQVRRPSRVWTELFGYSLSFLVATVESVVQSHCVGVREVVAGFAALSKPQGAHERTRLVVWQAVGRCAISVHDRVSLIWLTIQSPAPA